MTELPRGDWALILGVSSGFGEATARELSRRGMNIFGVHLDRRSTLPKVEEIKQAIQTVGCQASFWNVNAADAEKRREIVAEIFQKLEPGKKKIRVLLHSLAFGTLKPYMASPGDAINQAQMEMTLDVMANSLVYWTQDLYQAGLLGVGSRIYAMTSEGSSRIWATYGAVSAAKAALESHIRQLAYELGRAGVTANAIRAGVTNTPALRKIPGSEGMLKGSERRNPTGRLTVPEDVAKAIATLSVSDTQWITGNVIGVDGGEFVVS